VLVESALRIIVLAAGVAVGLRVLRVASPRVAHHAWTGVCAVRLLLPAIVAWAPEALLPILPPETAAVVGNATAPDSGAIVQPGSVDGTIDPDVASGPITWRLIVRGVYAVVAVVLLTSLAFGWWHARTMIRQTTRVGGRLTHPRCVTPVTLGLWAPVVILPPDWTEWDETELAAVLAHEEEHVRRRDPLVAFITLINRAIFWFHPLSWWLRREISALSEQACDAAVISRGHDKEHYAAILLRFARASATMGGRIVPFGTAMPGAGLPRRLKMLETSPRLPPSTLRTTGITAAYLLAVVICTGATPIRAQVPAAGPTGATAWRSHSSEHFEVFYTTDQEGRAAGVAREAEEAYARLMESLKYDLTQRVRLILAGPAFTRDDVATQDLLRPSGAAGAAAIVVAMDDSRPGALLHELAHAFTVEIAPNLQSTAPWLMEGFAEHTRGIWDTRNLESMRRALQTDGIPGIAAMADAPWGQALFDYIVARSGEEGVRRFFFALRSRPEVGTAIQAAFGDSPAAFGQTFSAYVRDRFSVR
jgi:hypothetical protein